MTMSPEIDLDEMLGVPSRRRQTSRRRKGCRAAFQNWTDDDLEAEPDTSFLIGDETGPYWARARCGRYTER